MRFLRLSAPGAAALSLWRLEASAAELRALFGALPPAGRPRPVAVGEPPFDRGLLWLRGAATEVRGVAGVAGGAADDATLIAELHLHGGYGVADALRAWLRGHRAVEVDSTEALEEAEAGFLQARSAAAASAWSALRGGAFEARLEALRAATPEERAAGLAELAQGRAWAEVLEAPPRLVLAGPPNAGKSTLLNRWLGRPRATVSESAGTTRDAVAALVPVGHGGATFLLQLVDTAGLWPQAAGVDRDAVAASEAEIRSAWRVLWIFDAAEEPHPEVCARFHQLRRAEDLLLLNRSDLGTVWNPEDLLGGEWLRGGAPPGKAPATAADGARADALPARLEAALLAALGPAPAPDALLPLGAARRAALDTLAAGGG